MTHHKGLQIFTGFTVACKSYILLKHICDSSSLISITQFFLCELYILKKINYEYSISIFPFFGKLFFQIRSRSNFEERGSRNETSTLHSAYET